MVQTKNQQEIFIYIFWEALLSIYFWAVESQSEKCEGDYHAYAKQLNGP